MNFEEKKYWVWFTLIKGIGIKRKIKLLELFNNPKNIYNLTEGELLCVNDLGKKLVNNILKAKDERIINKHLKYMENNNIDVIHIFEKSYPQNLKEIYDPPICLFIKGNKEILNR